MTIPDSTPPEPAVAGPGPAPGDDPELDEPDPAPRPTTTGPHPNDDPELDEPDPDLLELDEPDQDPRPASAAPGQPARGNRVGYARIGDEADPDDVDDAGVVDFLGADDGPVPGGDTRASEPATDSDRDARPSLPVLLSELSRQHLVGLITGAAVVVFLSVLLLSGALAPPLRAAAFAATASLVVSAVALLPRHWWIRAGSLAVVLVAVVGIGAVAPDPRADPVESGQPVTPRPTAPGSGGVDAARLATLIRGGPFTERLPGAMRVGRIGGVHLSDVSAVQRIDAVTLEVAPADPRLFVVVETYPTAEAAAARSSAAAVDLRRRYAGTAGRTRAGPASCLAGTAGAGEWYCWTSHGHVYVEITASPASTPQLTSVTGVLDAVLRYVDRMTFLATP